MRFFSFVVGLSALLRGDVAFGQVSLSAEIRESLEKNSKSLTPLELTWERSRKSDLPVTRILERIKYGQASIGEMQPYKVRFLCDNLMYYSRTSRYSAHVDIVDGKIVPSLTKPMHIVEEDSSFDGNICYTGNPVEAGKGDSSMIKKTAAKAASDDPERRLFYPDFLQWAGYHMPQTPREFDKPLHSSVLFEADAPGVASCTLEHEDVGGAIMDVARIKTAMKAVKYVLDPAKGHAVIRRTEETTSGKRLTNAECSDFVKLEGREVWLPKRIRVDWHTWETIPKTIEPKPLITEEFQLLEWKTDPIPPEQFALHYDRPGSLVTDYAVAGAEKFKDGGVNYRIPARPEDLDDVIAVTLGKDPKKGGGWLFYANVLILSALGLFVVYRQLRIRRQES
jgi:hypothetical protein